MRGFCEFINTVLDKNDNLFSCCMKIFECSGDKLSSTYSAVFFDTRMGCTHANLSSTHQHHGQQFPTSQHSPSLFPQRAAFSPTFLELSISQTIK
jgi:hypothetical protein